MTVQRTFIHSRAGFLLALVGAVVVWQPTVALEPEPCGCMLPAPDLCEFYTTTLHVSALTSQQCPDFFTFDDDFAIQGVNTVTEAKVRLSDCCAIVLSVPGLSQGENGLCLQSRTPGHIRL